MKVQFEVAVTRNEEEAAWTAAGWDEVEYRIATNPGEPLKPLDEIASGGELTRVMLALKVAVEETSSKTKKKTRLRARWSSTKSTSASEGAPLKPSARSSRRSSRGQQVLCVTHLPQIAAFADQHLAVEKREDRRPHQDANPRARRPRPHA